MATSPAAAVILRLGWSTLLLAAMAMGGLGSDALAPHATQVVTRRDPSTCCGVMAMVCEPVAVFLGTPKSGGCAVPLNDTLNSARVHVVDGVTSNGSIGVRGTTHGSALGVAVMDCVPLVPRNAPPAPSKKVSVARAEKGSAVLAPGATAPRWNPPSAVSCTMRRGSLFCHATMLRSGDRALRLWTQTVGQGRTVSNCCAVARKSARTPSTAMLTLESRELVITRCASARYALVTLVSTPAVVR